MTGDEEGFGRGAIVRIVGKNARSLFTMRGLGRRRGKHIFGTIQCTSLDHDMVCVGLRAPSRYRPGKTVTRRAWLYWDEIALVRPRVRR